MHDTRWFRLDHVWSLVQHCIPLIPQPGSHPLQPAAGTPPDLLLRVTADQTTLTCHTTSGQAGDAGTVASLACRPIHAAPVSPPVSASVDEISLPLLGDAEQPTLYHRLRSGVRHRLHWLAISRRHGRATVRLFDHRHDLVPAATPWRPATVWSPAVSFPTRTGTRPWFPAMVADGYIISGDDIVARFPRRAVHAMLAHLSDPMAWADSTPAELATLRLRRNALIIGWSSDDGRHETVTEIDRVYPHTDGPYSVGAYLWPWHIHQSEQQPAEVHMTPHPQSPTAGDDQGPPRPAADRHPGMAMITDTSQLPRPQSVIVDGVAYWFSVARDPILSPDRLTYDDRQRDAFHRGEWAFTTVMVTLAIRDVNISEQAHGVAFGHIPGQPTVDMQALTDTPAVVQAIDACRNRLHQLAQTVRSEAEPHSNSQPTAAALPGALFTSALTPAQFAAAVPALARYRLSDIAAALADLAPDGPALLTHDGVLYEITGRYALTLARGYYAESVRTLPAPWSGSSQPLPVPAVDSHTVAERLRRPRAVLARADTVDAHGAARLLADVTGMLRHLTPAGHDPRVVLDALDDAIGDFIGVVEQVARAVLLRTQARPLEQTRALLSDARRGLAAALRAMSPADGQPAPPSNPRLDAVTVTPHGTGHAARGVVRDRYHPDTATTVDGAPAATPDLAFKNLLTAVADMPATQHPQSGVHALPHATHPAADTPRAAEVGSAVTAGPTSRDYLLTVELSGPIDPVTVARGIHPMVAALARTYRVHAAGVQRDTVDGAFLHSPVICRPAVGAIGACLLPAAHLGPCSPTPDTP
jgi:hypothetical protein